MVQRIMIALLPLLLLLLTGCSARHAKAPTSSADYGSYDGYYEAEDEAVYRAESARSSRARSERVDMMSRDAPGAPPPEEPAVEDTPTRMVYYNGYMHLKVAQPEDTTAAVAQLARDMGGYVESLSTERVVVRIPVDAFEETFAKALELGELLDQNISAEDVTEAFTDVSLRLQTLKSTHERLVELLARAQTESEKLALLQQIRRVSEQIDVVEGQMRTLAELASFSRLTVQASPRGAFANQTAQTESEGLDWIQQLSPFSRSVGEYSKRVSMAVPEGMVMLNPRGRFIVESADGAMMWTSRLENDPRGEAAFWVEAIEERLAAEFETDSAQSVGGFVLLRMVEQDEPDGYRYLVGVRENGKWLEVVQVYYPSAAHEARYGEAVLASIGGGAS